MVQRQKYPDTPAPSLPMALPTAPTRLGHLPSCPFLLSFLLLSLSSVWGFFGTLSPDCSLLLPSIVHTAPCPHTAWPLSVTTAYTNSYTVTLFCVICLPACPSSWNSGSSRPEPGFYWALQLWANDFHPEHTQGRIWWMDRQTHVSFPNSTSSGRKHENLSLGILILCWEKAWWFPP